MSKEELRHCPNCGAPAKVRYRQPYTWVECKKKCGIKTHEYPDYGEQNDPQARQNAIEEWNSLGEEEE